MRAPFAVIFDMDGVLLDTENIAKQCWKAAAEKTGWTGWEETYLSVVGNSMDVQQAAMNQALGEEGGTRFREVIREHFRSGFNSGPLPVKTGAREVLSYLHGQGIPLAVASSTIEEIVRRNLTFHGIRAAHFAGCRPVMVPDVLEPTAEIAALAEEIFPTLLETEEYFRFLCENGAAGN